MPEMKLFVFTRSLSARWVSRFAISKWWYYFQLVWKKGGLLNWGLEEIFLPYALQAVKRHLTCMCVCVCVSLCKGKPAISGASEKKNIPPGEEEGTAETNSSDYLAAGEKVTRQITQEFCCVIAFICNSYLSVCVCGVWDRVLHRCGGWLQKQNYFPFRARLFTLWSSRVLCLPAW